MDLTDLKILSLLEENSRISFTDISKSVNLSVPSVIDRIDKLVEKRIIEKNTIVINYEAFNRNISAIICVDVKADLYENFQHFCEKNKNIKRFVRVIGEYNCILDVCVENTQILESLIDQIRTYGTTATCLQTGTSFSNSIVRSIIDEKLT